MGNSTDRLMLNGVHLLESVVEDTGGVDCLESQHLVVEMSDVQTFGCESIWLDLNICARDGLEER
jgi:hypothetical protein